MATVQAASYKTGLHTATQTFTPGSTMSDQVIFYQFSRQAVCAGDFSDFINRFGPSSLPKGKQLAGMMNGLATFISGYDHDVREIYAIPEVRAFYSGLTAAWPYWLYFGNLHTEALMMVVLCTLKSLDARTVLGQPHSKVMCDPTELLGFVSRHLQPMNEMCERAGLSDRVVSDRMKQVFTYFGLPL